MDALSPASYFYAETFILISPQDNKWLKFFHWNLNSISARGRMKIPFNETYDSLYKYDIIAISETMLDYDIIIIYSTEKNNKTHIDGFSENIYRSDHPSNTKMGGTCLCFRDGLPIKRRIDLELLPEMIISDVTITGKKVFLGTLYRSPSQSSHQFETFIDILQQVIDKMSTENPNCIFLTGDHNCRPSIWWKGDIEQP